MKLLPFDILTTIIILVVLFFINHQYGRKFAISVIMAFYPAIIIFPNIPYISFNTNISALIGFLVIYGLVFFTIWKNTKTHHTESYSRKMIEFALNSIAIFSLYLYTSVKILPMLRGFYEIPFTNLISSQIHFGLILIIPIIVILFTNRRLS